MKERLRELFARAGLETDALVLDRFEIYAQMLEKRGKEMNLIADTAPEEIAIRHFLDSLTLIKMGIAKDAEIIDVGTGAGFPGLPVKIFMPSVKMTLLDSLGKRLVFLEELKEALQLDSLDIVNARGEEASLLPEYRGQYDLVFSRAVARMNILTEICLPFAKKGGCFYAMKSQHTDEEIEEALTAIKVLGGKLSEKYDYELPERETKLRIFKIEKIKDTPEGFPRRFAKMKQKPL